MQQTCPKCNTPWSPWGYCLNDGTLRQQGLLIGERYALEQPIGKGGMGMVFAARHKLLGKRVAVKVLHADLLASAVQVGRFLREAQLCSQLHHENIVDITDFGRDANGSLFLVMELLDGTTLASVLSEDSRLPRERALPILRQICRALAAAHQAGVVHRDLTPRNVMLSEVSGRSDVVKLLDFGISRLEGGQDRVTQTGIPLGTVAYMPPEQLRGEAVQDHHVDIYALGVMIHEVLTGRLPFIQTTDAQLVAEKLVGPTVDLSRSDFARSFSALSRLVAECLAPDPARRPASAVEVEQRLLDSGGIVGEVSESLTGMRAGSYRMVRPIGAGGLGSVWLGEHPVIGSRVAVKVLLPEVSESPEAVRRFISEAQAVNRMNCSNIVKIFDFGKLADGRDYAVMELLDGETLGQRIDRQGALELDECRAVALGIIRALRMAHDAGVIHRDLKPDNVFLHQEPDTTVVKVLDFGIAKLLSGEGQSIHQTQVGFGLGTPLYAAPEQMEGAAAVGPAVDIYSLGVVLYEMLSGTPPFAGTLSELMLAKVAGRIPALPSSVPDRLGEMIGIMLAPRPEDRPAMETVLAVLEGCDRSTARAAPGPSRGCSSAVVTPTRIGTPPSPHALAERGTSSPAAPPPEVVSPPPPDPLLAPRSPWLDRRRLILLAAAGIALAVIGAGIALIGASRSRPDGARLAAPRATVRSTAAAPHVRGAGPVVTPLTDARPPDSAARRTVVVSSTPEGARVWLDGEAVGTTPLTLRLDPRLGEVELVLARRGYRRRRHRLSARSGGRVSLQLEKLEKKREWHDPFHRRGQGPASKRPRRHGPAKPLLADPFE